MGAFGAAFLAMQASGFSDLYKVTYNGEVLADGSTIIVNHAELDDYYGEWAYDNVDIHVESTGSETQLLKGALYTVSPATVSELREEAASSMCFVNSPGLGGNCLMANGTDETCLGDGFVYVGAAGWVSDDPFGEPGPFYWDIHFDEVTDPAKVFEVKMVLTAAQGTIKDPTLLPQTMTVTIKYGTELASVEALGVEKRGAKEYFSLDGRRLDGAVKGLYLVRENGRTRKVIGK